MANWYPSPTESLAISATTRIDNLLSLTLYEGLGVVRDFARKTWLRCGSRAVAEFARISVCLHGESVSAGTESLATSATTRIDNLLSLTLYEGLMRESRIDSGIRQVFGKPHRIMLESAIGSPIQFIE